VKIPTFAKTPMFISGIPHIKTLFQSLPGTFVGVGMTAYSRIVPASFLKEYRIVALHPTGDLPLLRKQIPIFCLLEEAERGTPERNSAALMAHPLTRRFVDGLSDPKYFFLYQDYPELRSLAETHGWRLLANSPELRRMAGKRDFFKKMTAQLGLPQIPGDMCPIGAIHQKGYEEWRHQLGPVFVVQLPEIEQGGGRGTFFVRTAEDYLKLQGRLRENRWRDTPLETVSLKQFVEGIPASVTACVTRHGTLVSALQRQLSPNSPAERNLQASRLIAAGNSAEALQPLQQALDAPTTDQELKGWAYFHSARARVALEQKDEAFQALFFAINHARGHGLVKRITRLWEELKQQDREAEQATNS